MLQKIATQEVPRLNYLQPAIRVPGFLRMAQFGLTLSPDPQQPSSGPLPNWSQSGLAADDLANAILVVEDNAGDLFLIQEALRANRVTNPVIVARDGQEAIDFIDTLQAQRKSCVRLVILDLNLPRRNGFEVLSRIRSSSMCRDAFVAIFSSSDAEKDRAEMKARGANDYFRKPTRLETFLDFGSTVRAILERMPSA